MTTAREATERIGLLISQAVVLGRGPDPAEIRAIIQQAIDDALSAGGDEKPAAWMVTYEWCVAGEWIQWHEVFALKEDRLMAECIEGLQPKEYFRNIGKRPLYTTSPTAAKREALLDVAKCFGGRPMAVAYDGAKDRDVVVRVGMLLARAMSQDPELRRLAAELAGDGAEKGSTETLETGHGL